MLGFPSNLFTGIEISPFSLKMAQVLKEKKGWTLIACNETPLPADVLELSYKNKNIVDPPMFLAALRTVLNGASGNIRRVGLSLPNEVVKISLYRFDEIPQSRTAIKELISWQEKATLPFPPQRASIAYAVFSGPPIEKGKSVLSAFGSRDIIGDYERNLKRLRIDAEVIQPSAVNHVNFYSTHLPLPGIVAFLGVFQNFFTFLVFEEGQLIFYRGKRRSTIAVHFLQEIDMNIELFLTEHPGKDLQFLFLQCQYKPSEDFLSEFQSYFDVNIEVIPEEKLLEIGESVKKQTGMPDIASYASAIGAAQSLASL